MAAGQLPDVLGGALGQTFEADGTDSVAPGLASACANIFTALGVAQIFRLDGDVLALAGARDDNNHVPARRFQVRFHSAAASIQCTPAVAPQTVHNDRILWHKCRMCCTRCTHFQKVGTYQLKSFRALLHRAP